MNIQLWLDSALKIGLQKNVGAFRESVCACTAQSLSISQLETENTGQVPEELYPICKAERAQIILRAFHAFSLCI